MKKQFTELIGAFCALIFFTLLTTSTAQGQYCPSTATASGFEFISEVSYGLYVNPSPEEQYADNTADGSIGNISPGIESTIGVQVTEAWPGDNIYIYIDGDGDGDFTLADLVGQASSITTENGSASPVDVSIPITVPLGSLPGETRLRVKMGDGVVNDPCEPTFTFGEVEDYLITIVEGSCTPIAVEAVEVDNCDNGTYDIQATITDPGDLPFGSFISFEYTINGDPESEASFPVPVLPLASYPITILAGVDAADVINGVFKPGLNPLCFNFQNFESPNTCPPSNDLPCDAIPIVADGSTNTYSNIGSTSDAGEPILSFSEGSTVWFSVVGPETGRLNLSTCVGEDSNTDFDTTIGLFEAEVCGDYTTYTQVGFNDDNFTACGNFGPSDLEVCVTPGTTYLVQVDGFFAEQGVFDLTATAVDGGVCLCEPAGPWTEFIVNTAPICNGEEELFSMTFFAPTQLGSQEAVSFTYDWEDNPNEDPIEVLVSTEDVTLEQLFPLTTIVTVTINLTDPNCAEFTPLPFPFGESFPITQEEFACDPDCEGVDGGPAQPGIPCDIDGAPGTWSEDCECILAPENATCETAIALECNTTVSGTNVAAFPIPADIQAAVPGGLTGGLAVFYTITVTETSLVSLETCLDDELGNPITTFDTDLRVMTGDCVNGFAGEATFNEGAGSPGYVDDFDESGLNGPFDCGTTNTFRAGGDFIAEADVTYTIVVSGWSDTQIGEFDLQVTCEPIAAGASIAGTVPNWSNLCSERGVSIDLYQLGSLILEASYEATLASDGTFSVEGVAVGTFDVFVKLEGYLTDGFASVELADGQNDLEVPAPRLGDLNNNNVVNFVDGSAFNNFLTPLPYDAFADYNCDGNVNFVDASALNQTFGITGDNPPLSIDQE